MENGPFVDDFPIRTSIYKGFSMAMLNNQMVVYLVKSYHLVMTNIAMENHHPCLEYR